MFASCVPYLGRQRYAMVFASPLKQPRGVLAISSSLTKWRHHGLYFEAGIFAKDTAYIELYARSPYGIWSAPIGTLRDDIFLRLPPFTIK